MTPSRMLEPAEQEMLEAATWYDDRARGLGLSFLAATKEAIRGIEEAPERWPQVGHGLRRRVLRRFPYSIYYGVGAKEVLIVAIAHQKRRPYYWLGGR